MDRTCRFPHGTLRLTTAAALCLSCALTLAESLIPTSLSSPGPGLPDGWQPWLPEWPSAAVRVIGTPQGIRIDGGTNDWAVGGVVRSIPDVRGGQAYAVDVRVQTQSIPAPGQSLLVRVEWLEGGNVLHPAGELVRGPVVDGPDAWFRDVLVAPTNADHARLSLEVQWPRGGTVHWREAGFRPAEPPPPRIVRVGTVYLRPRDSTPARNLEAWCDQIDAAGKLRLDIVCLSEAILQVGTPARTSDLAETLPGPSTARLGDAARRNRLWVVAGLLERDGDRLFNTAVLLDRAGQLAGRYRKTHLPREEWRKGITPGEAYPVFQTDFGTIAIQVCYDLFFPEPALLFAGRGAEILFAPTWGTTFADHDGLAEGRTVLRVRARDSGLYLVPSVYDGESLIIDPLGRVLAASGGATGVFWAEIDLNRREPLWWVGHWGSIGPRHRRPETYGGLLDFPSARPRDEHRPADH